MILRDYQQDAVDAAIAWLRSSLRPALLELATGAGKSLIVAAIAQWVQENTGKRVLCLAPSKELTEQNHAKYPGKASIFSASAGSKCLKHNVVFGTPGTVKNNIRRFGDQFGCIILDEAHGITPTIIKIIDAVRACNPQLRVIGMTASPYRMLTGYIYQYDVDGSFVEEAKDPYFNTLLYRIQTDELIARGYLTPINVDPTAEKYEARDIDVNDLAAVERVFEGHGRKTAAIVADIVAHSVGRKGVMIFAATVQHAKEICASLPAARMLAGDEIKKSYREQVVNDFKAQKFKYIVSVGMLTTGFDATHVDVIAVLRATGSPGLFQQIIGRGMRLHEGKKDCILLDYAENIERHKLHNNLFQPEIKAYSGKPKEKLDAECKSCGFINRFTARPNPDKFQIDQFGIFLDAAGEQIKTPSGPMPAHFGRRCTGQDRFGERCNHRWTVKMCVCGAENDIAARYCEVCKAEIVDPNEKLRLDFIRLKKNPCAVSTDEVLEWLAYKSVTAKGEDTLICEYKTAYRRVKYWYTPESSITRKQAEWKALSMAVFNGRVAPSIDMFLQYLNKGTPPKTITYKKQNNSDFFIIYAYNERADEIPKMA